MAGRRRSGGVGTMLVLIGLLAVLGTTFGAGFLAGRRWSLPSWSAGGDAKRETPHDPTHAGARGSAEESTPVPTITFYRELTAPAPEAAKPRAESAKRPGATAPAPARAARDGSRPATEPAREPSGGAPSRESGERAPPSATAGSATREKIAERIPDGAAQLGTSYTVQVAAYSNRSQADALKKTLAVRGLEAEVSEVTTPAGPRYRVWLGRYATRAAAQEAAVRVAQHARLDTYVAPR
jgi:cell division protein FtsN